MATENIIESGNFSEGLPPKETLGTEAEILADMNIMCGVWREVKKMSDDRKEMYSRLGISYIKRKVLSGYTSKVEIKIDKNSRVFMRAFFPMGIEKRSEFLADGVTVQDQPDSDTCDWKVVATYMNGFLIQRREGSLGTMFDTRCVIRRDDQIYLLFHWVFQDRKGNRLARNIWMQKIAEGSDCSTAEPSTESGD